MVDATTQRPHLVVTIPASDLSLDRHFRRLVNLLEGLLDGGSIGSVDFLLGSVAVNRLGKCVDQP